MDASESATGGERERGGRRAAGRGCLLHAGFVGEEAVEALAAGHVGDCKPDGADDDEVGAEEGAAELPREVTGVSDEHGE